jgi:hypothetical protein
MSKNNVIVVSLVILVFGLIFWSRFTSPDYKQVKVWNSYGVDCLPNGHQNLGQHIHPDIFVTIDGNPVAIPANIGINTQCMAELHTHDTTGKIHIETIDPNREMMLGQFFDMWGEPIKKEGYTLMVTMGSTTVNYDTNPEVVEDHVMSDFEQIHFTYVSATSTQAVVQ